jgi:hypothetical protein
VPVVHLLPDVDANVDIVREFSCRAQERLELVPDQKLSWCRISSRSDAIAFVASSIARSDGACTPSPPRASTAAAGENAASALPSAVPLRTVRLLIVMGSSSRDTTLDVCQKLGGNP